MHRLPINKPKASNKHTSALGKRVAKDFGKLGVFFGVVQSVEYDTDDAGEERPFYVVEYTDGDREDNSDNELKFACELALQISMDEEDNTQMSEAHTFRRIGKLSPTEGMLSLVTLLLMISSTLITIPLLQKQPRTKKFNASSKKTNASKKDKHVESDSSSGDSESYRPPKVCCHQ